jgi:hypothetical protein
MFPAVSVLKQTVLSFVATLLLFPCLGPDVAVKVVLLGNERFSIKRSPLETV